MPWIYCTYAVFFYGIRHPYKPHSHYPRFLTGLTCCAVLVPVLLLLLLLRDPLFLNPFRALKRELQWATKLGNFNPVEISGEDARARVLS